ncbi:unnamed protein product [Clonostachys rosea]|uniref:Nephrocystin 3-like N-terminal domain-containing protein n=1 Tax=Bionectria ochroleuca TaxID=29856 RepID=A0ABY6UBD0_BIOOC|nr:unnamed protein product [Clonostachys rosea]
MSQFGRTALKWPFESKDIDKFLLSFARFRETLTTALTIDHTQEVVGMSQEQVLSQLPVAKYASYDAYADEHDTRCHPKTRVDLRKDIMSWAEDPEGPRIFWLNGMAGTGKSTISRTLAQAFADRGCLGGSFFFKRGERDRGSAAQLFTTLCSQLIAWKPALAPHVRAAMDADRTVTTKSLRDQFGKLILSPLGKLEEQLAEKITVVFVIDALDECERDDEITEVVHLLSQAKVLSTLILRTLITSRPEIPIRLGFHQIGGNYQDLILHDVPKPVIEHDIAVFFDDRLEQVRDRYNSTCREERRLPPDWPGSDATQSLVQMAIPLFIFAATVCRFVEDRAWNDPAGQLSKILQYTPATSATGQHAELDKLDMTYRPVLDQLIIGRSQATQKALADEFKRVVGPIVLLAEALSIPSLARLLDIRENELDRRLDSLHSVFSVPSSGERPVRMLHLSFRDFLVDSDKRDHNPFWINERVVHEQIASKCLELLTSSGHLKKDICNVKRFGAMRAEVEPSVVDKCLPAEVRYACLYWVQHLEQSRMALTENHPAYKFLTQHFLHWLEALSLLGKISEGIAMINSLRALVNPTSDQKLDAFLYDANRFILNYRSIIDLCPLQLYASAMIFTPQESIIRGLFKHHASELISTLPNVDLTWDACLQALEGGGGRVNVVLFSPDGKLIASGSEDATIYLYQAATGELRHTLEGRRTTNYGLVFSPDSKTIALVRAGNSVCLWDTITGALRCQFEVHTGWTNIAAFSPDSKIIALALGSQGIRLYNIATSELQDLPNHDTSANAVSFSPNGKTIASAFDDNMIRLWDPSTGKLQRTLRGHSDSVKDVTFSPDGKVMASRARDSTVRLWDTSTGETRYIFSGSMLDPVYAGGLILFSPNSMIFAILGGGLHGACLWDATTGKLQHTLEPEDGSQIKAIAFSPDSKTLASALSNKTVCLWDAATGKTQHTLEGHTSPVHTIAFSPDGRLIASGSSDEMVRLWDTSIVGTPQQAIERSSRHVEGVLFSPDGKIVLSAAWDRILRLWDTTTGALRHKLDDNAHTIDLTAFSPNSTMIASVPYDRTVRVWSVSTGALHHTLKGQGASVEAITFSPDSRIIASASSDRKIRLWDTSTGALRHTLKDNEDDCTKLMFSPDGKTFASMSENCKAIRLWDVMTGELQHKLESNSGPFDIMAFSPDSEEIASVLDYTIRIWGVATGAVRLTLEGHENVIEDVAFSPDGNIIASAARDDTVRLWDAVRGGLLSKLILPYFISQISFNDDGRFIKTEYGLINVCSAVDQSSNAEH